jgi:8-oxo-dGTP pyrophosphatase MutT (NUDIX family)
LIMLRVIKTPPPSRAEPMATFAQSGNFFICAEVDDESGTNFERRHRNIMTIVPSPKILQEKRPFLWQGAAVLPIMVDPLNPSRQYIGMCRSARSNRLKTISGRVHTSLDVNPYSERNDWCDSRGINICKTAAREFFEETLGSLKLYDIVRPCSFGHIWKEWAREMASGHYMLSIIEAVPSWSIEWDHHVRFYVVFVIRIKWDPQSISRFRRTRYRFLRRHLHVNHPIARLGYPSYFGETSDLHWEPYFEASTTT